MFGRGSRKRLSSRSLTASGEPERGQPCNTCGDQCPGFALHKWRNLTVPVPDKRSKPWPSPGSAPSPLPTFCCLKMSSC
ncbi:prickle planar cell polarity protein 3-like isoform X2 [Melospiza melodia melodia]|uniref:prickle planar cell polarity protein 3-like isoform X2 n=1 Tax=Melospiza melodia melodia TaxID=1914991 RepID=UPI002FD354C2